MALNDRDRTFDTIDRRTSWISTIPTYMVEAHASRAAAMGKNIKNDEAHALAREIAAREGSNRHRSRAARAPRQARRARRRRTDARRTGPASLDFGRRYGLHKTGGSSDTSDLYDELGLPK
jgi:hypothetical protein